MTWSELSEWWRVELAEDSAYDDVVTPLLLEMLRPVGGRSYLDLGCGEGRVMRSVETTGAMARGVDLSEQLVSGIAGAVVADVLNLPLRPGVFDGVYSVLTLEHIEDHATFFAEAARVTKPSGVMALVINHPSWTAPGSTPITDDDGEVLWRPGDYFINGSTELSAGDGTVTFHHRSMSDLLNAAAGAGWSLEHMVEQPHHELEAQSGIPRLLACRWRLLP